MLTWGIARAHQPEIFGSEPLEDSERAAPAPGPAGHQPAETLPFASLLELAKACDVPRRVYAGPASATPANADSSTA
jgi:hypothetical protein